MEGIFHSVCETWEDYKALQDIKFFFTQIKKKLDKIWFHAEMTRIFLEKEKLKK